MSKQNDGRNIINQNKKTNSKVYPERKPCKKKQKTGNSDNTSQKNGKSRYYRKSNRYNNSYSNPKNDNRGFYNPQYYYYTPPPIEYPQFIIPIQQNQMDSNSLCCSPKLKDTILLDTSSVIPYKYDFSKANTKLPIDIKTIDDLIEIGDRYHEYSQDPNVLYNIDTYKVLTMKEPLMKLRNLIGLENIKQQVFDVLCYYLQGLDDGADDMLHTVIDGPPGVGKTEMAKILADLYQKMGKIPTNQFISVKRSDLIGGFLGQTAMKTQQALDKAKGGVLFIDEAYSIGDIENGKDSYSAECINTINAHLSEKKGEMICIIAGYKDSLDKMFFSQNEGLKRRFPYRFTIEPYNASELQEIFSKQVLESKWTMNTKKLEEFFKDNHTHFTFNGGDMETLLHKCKNAHSKRTINNLECNKKELSMEDINKGMEIFLENRGNKPVESEPINHLYM